MGLTMDIVLHLDREQQVFAFPAEADFRTQVFRSFPEEMGACRVVRGQHGELSGPVEGEVGLLRQSAAGEDGHAPDGTG